MKKFLIAATVCAGAFAVGKKYFHQVPETKPAMKPAYTKTEFHTTLAPEIKEAPKKKTRRLTDAQIRQKIIDEDWNDYPGPCACPYDTDRAGRRCGRRSAYNRPGGYAPRCFSSDISKTDIAQWLERNE